MADHSRDRQVAEVIDQVTDAPTRCPVRRRVWRLVLIGLLWVLSSRTHALVIAPGSLDDMAAASGIIVRGTITAVRGVPTADRRGIVSRIDVRVEEGFKGASGPGTSLVFEVPWGRVGRYRRILVGAPDLRPGDELFLFLMSAPRRLPVPYGLTSGMLRVVRGAGRALVAPSAPLTGQGETTRIVRGDPSRSPMPADAFAREIRRSLERRP
ncbi:MAG: hypothetical protein AB7G23_17475 [Vicinamibacterales bacterium]